MSCNTCFKSFSLLRPEKGCPGCGFSYCSKCLCHKIYVSRLNAEAKVCLKCKALAESGKINVPAPDAYYKQLASSVKPENPTPVNENSSSIEEEVRKRLDKLKEKDTKTTNEEIQERLQNIKGETPSTDAELIARLAKLRGVPVPTESKPIMTKDLRTEQEQVEDLMKQYLENTAIDCKYKDEFNSLINDMEARIHRLKGENGASGSQTNTGSPERTTGLPQRESAADTDSEDEEASVMKIVEKIKAQALKEEEELAPSTNDELPFCEICNEDAVLRCLGCRYLFCKRCFKEHKDDEDCNRSEPYQAPKGIQY